MKMLSLALVLLSSPAFAQTYGRVHPAASECVTTDADCLTQHDSRILTLALNMGDAMYCRASTTPAKCTETVEMINGDYVPAEPECMAADAACTAARDSRVLTLALDTGDPMYCKTSTTPAACTEAVEMIDGDYVPVETSKGEPVPVKVTPAAKPTHTLVPHGATVIDLSGPADPDADLPVVAKKGAL